MRDLEVAVTPREAEWRIRVAARNPSWVPTGRSKEVCGDLGAERSMAVVQMLSRMSLSLSYCVYYILLLAHVNLVQELITTMMLFPSMWRYCLTACIVLLIYHVSGLRETR